MTTDANAYVLGTADDELARLEHQHGIWRAAAEAGWRRAGIAEGHTVLDLGAGPGFAAADLAQLVGARGRVIALDKSRRFLDVIAARGLPQLDPRPCDLDGDELPVPDGSADAAWARWVFCFLGKPRALLTRAARALKPGGAIVIHEYFDYRTWRSAPRTPEVEEFVTAVMASWRAQGGEPDIALSLLPWLDELGFELIAATPIIEVVPPGHPKWQWVTAFGTSGLARLVELGQLTAERAAAIAATWPRLAAQPGTRMVTPAVMELVARKRT